MSKYGARIESKGLPCGRCGCEVYVTSACGGRVRCRDCDRRYKAEHRVPLPKFFELRPPRPDHSRCVPGGALCDECAVIWAEVTSGEIELAERGLSE